MPLIAQKAHQSLASLLSDFCLGNGAKDCGLEPLILEIQYDADAEIQVEKSLIRGLYH